MAHVYVFQSGGENLFKIRRTRGDVEKRRKDGSTGNPHPLTTSRVIETDHDSLFENFLHKKFLKKLSHFVADDWVERVAICGTQVSYYFD